MQGPVERCRRCNGTLVARTMLPIGTRAGGRHPRPRATRRHGISHSFLVAAGPVRARLEAYRLECADPIVGRDAAQVGTCRLGPVP
jgi:hypothetical protein